MLFRSAFTVEQAYRTSTTSVSHNIYMYVVHIEQKLVRLIDFTILVVIFGHQVFFKLTLSFNLGLQTNLFEVKMESNLTVSRERTFRFYNVYSPTSDRAPAFSLITITRSLRIRNSRV